MVREKEDIFRGQVWRCERRERGGRPAGRGYWRRRVASKGGGVWGEIGRRDPNVCKPSGLATRARSMLAGWNWLRGRDEVGR